MICWPVASLVATDAGLAAIGIEPEDAHPAPAGAMAGALKKRLGLEVTSETVEGRGRVYSLPRD